MIQDEHLSNTFQPEREFLSSYRCHFRCQDFLGVKIQPPVYEVPVIQYLQQDGAGETQHARKAQHTATGGAPLLCWVAHPQRSNLLWV